MKVLGRFKAAVCAGVLVLASLVGVSAAQVNAAEEIPKQRLQISPARINVDDLEPGEEREISFKVQNTGSEALGYEVSITPFSVHGEDYQQDFNTETNYTDIAKWITLSQDSGKVQPDKEQEVKVTIKVPNDVPAGGQYATIMVRAVNPDDGDSSEGAAVSVFKQVGMIIYGSVAGETRKEGSIQENKVPSFMFAPPITTTSIVENTGNVHMTATYILQVFPLFSNEEVYTNEESPATAMIMPETRRLNTLTWEGAPQLGIFKVRQTVKFLDEESTVEKLLFICPIWFMLIILVLIFLVIFWIISRVRGRKDD